MTIIKVTCTVELELEVDGTCPDNISEVLHEKVPNHLLDGAFDNSVIVDVSKYVIFINRMDIANLKLNMS